MSGVSTSAKHPKSIWCQSHHPLLGFSAKGGYGFITMLAPATGYQAWLAEVERLKLYVFELESFPYHFTSWTCAWSWNVMGWWNGSGWDVMTWDFVIFWWPRILCCKLKEISFLPREICPCKFRRLGASHESSKNWSIEPWWSSEYPNLGEVGDANVLCRSYHQSPKAKHKKCPRKFWFCVWWDWCDVFIQKSSKNLYGFVWIKNDFSHDFSIQNQVQWFLHWNHAYRCVWLLSLYGFVTISYI